MGRVANLMREWVEETCYGKQTRYRSDMAKDVLGFAMEVAALEERIVLLEEGEDLGGERERALEIDPALGRSSMDLAVNAFAEGFVQGVSWVHESTALGMRAAVETLLNDPENQAQVVTALLDRPPRFRAKRKKT